MLALPEIIPNWHPIFVHFTIALFSISTLLIVASLFIKNDFMEKVLVTSYINLWLGCLITCVTVAAGWYAYNTVAHDEPSHMAMTDHRNWGFGEKRYAFSRMVPQSLCRYASQSTR